MGRGDGFCAVAWPNDRTGGYKHCDVRFDPKARHLACRENGARWDLQGKVVRNPDPSRYSDDPLSILLVRISLDGHVMVSPNVYGREVTIDLAVT